MRVYARPIERRTTTQLGQDLIALVEHELPRDFRVTGDHDAWPFIGVALLSRTTGVLSALLEVSDGNSTDAGTLTRSLYEHVVHFAWLAADPTPARLGEWRKVDLLQRLKADKDAADHGIALLEDRPAMEAQVAALAGRERLALADIAAEADRAWEKRVEEIEVGGLRSLRGFYAILYRHTSGTVHPGFRGINPVVTDLGPVDRRVHLEENPTDWSPFSNGVIIFVLGLLIASESLGWPDRKEVTGLVAEAYG
jgi:hypothetical protein